MDKFIEQHADRISGTLGCFDRVLFRGYLPIMSGAAMATFLKSRDVMRETLKAFLLAQAEWLKSHAQNGSFEAIASRTSLRSAWRRSRSRSATARPRNTDAS
jgi:hypothetical protein